MIRRTKKNNGILKASIGVVIVVTLAKILGLGKQMAISALFGTSIETDIMSLAQEFISNIQYIFAQMILTAFTAIYIHIKADGEEESHRFLRDTLSMFFLVSLIVVGILYAVSPIISHILAPTYEVERSSLLSHYLRIYSFTLIPSILISIFGSLLNANDRYVINESSNLLQNIIVIVVVLILGSTIGIDVQIYSTFAYCIFNLLYLGVAASKYYNRHIHLNRVPWYKSDNIKKLLKMLAPLLIGYSMVFVNEQVDKILVSGMKAGTVTALNFGSSLSNLVTMLVASLCSIFFTKITVHIANKDNKATSEFLCRSLTIFITKMIPIFVVTFTCPRLIVSIVFERGAFNAESVEMTALSLMGYSLSFIPFVINNIFNRFQYGNKKTKWPMLISAIGIIINIVLSIILSRFLGVLGITLATSISAIVCASFTAVITLKMYEYLSIVELKGYVVYWVLGGCLSALVSLGVNNHLPISNKLIKFMFIVMIAFAVYGVIILPKLKTIIKRG